jgi:D-beta-D-heptose 7-phosphate kinase / D-beta-D-heptose 1-phosphate adenosyltransferase
LLVSSSFARFIDSFRFLDVVVIGEAMLDTYFRGSTDRLCREAPVPIVAVSQREDAPGGAANTAVNAAALGARVHLVSVIGADAEGECLSRLLDEQRIVSNDRYVAQGRRTLAKNRVIAASQLLIRFDQGSTGPIDRSAERHLIDRLHALVPRASVIIVSDYGYGILTPRVLEALADLQRRHARTFVADSKNLASYKTVGVTAIKPNFDEARALLGQSGVEAVCARPEWVAAHGESLLDRTGARMAAVTLDTDGAVLLERGQPPYRTYAKPARHSQAAGAGDTFLAAFGLALAAGAEAPDAADLASAACAVAVAREGTTPCFARELRSVLAESKPAADRSQLVRQLQAHRVAERRIVFTNGCFDILHRGHITYLSQAKALGDVLVVGVNSDSSIRRLKGPSRPINTLEDRMGVLAALSCVDHVIAFEEDTPCELVRAVRPDVFVKGGDYSLDRLPEANIVAQYGGEVRILPLVADRSTTNLIERIRCGHKIEPCESVAACATASDGVAGHVGLGGLP